MTPTYDASAISYDHFTGKAAQLGQNKLPAMLLFGSDLLLRKVSISVSVQFLFTQRRWLQVWGAVQTAFVLWSLVCTVHVGKEWRSPASLSSVQT